MRRKMTAISDDLRASRLPLRRKNGTSAQRQLSMYNFTAA